MKNEIPNTEEQQLHLRLREGDESVIDRLIELSEPIIISIAKQYGESGLTQKELIEAGKQALIECAKTELGNTGREKWFRFSAWYVRQGMLRAIDEKLK